ncbi:MAG: DUF4835 family protein [Bacteroidales bacterium]|nr:MAG: DUF4835 family protein [Bacteroidales bacterium]
MIKKLLLTTVFFLSINIYSQELNCNIQLVTQQIQGTNKQVFETLQGAIYEFMNNTSWTTHVFDVDERIECNMLFNLQDQIGDDEFRGTLQIQVRRPVYNSSFNTVLFNYVDNELHFKYVEYEPLEFSENSHISNLTSILAYYAYIILGLDYDSFSFEGGTEFFQKAEKIMINAQNASHKGWKSIESPSRKNRYWLINNILNEDFSAAREFIYRYHRSGLDMMYEKLNEARAEIAESLKLLQQVYRNKPDPFMHFLQVIYDAKSDELVNIFKESFPEEKTRVFAILNEIDPANTNKYEGIIR